jgi:CheY-like chemotaxis protein
MADKRKVLIIDDEKGFTSMLQLNLESMGSFDVRVENNSFNALEVAAQFQPDIILLDVIMPQMEGPDIAQGLRQHELLKNIPVIFLTATITKDEVNAGNGTIAGCTFVAKPSSFKELLASIQRNLQPSY